eukprot:3763768-Pleurochrysis_carterae.AAC.2
MAQNVYLKEADKCTVQHWRTNHLGGSKVAKPNSPVPKLKKRRQDDNKVTVCLSVWAGERACVRDCMRASACSRRSEEQSIGGPTRSSPSQRSAVRAAAFGCGVSAHADLASNAAQTRNCSLKRHRCDGSA